METAIKTMRESQNWSTAYEFILLEDLMRVGANWIGFGHVCIPRRETPSGSSAPTRAERFAKAHQMIHSRIYIGGDAFLAHK
jgi:hypothetical protein